MFWVSWLFVRKRTQQLFRNTTSSNRFSCCTKLTGTLKENTTSKSSKLFPQGSTIWIVFNRYHSNNVNVVDEYLLHKVKACQLPPSFWCLVILWNLSEELKCPRNFLDRKCSYFTLTSWHVPICKKVLLMSNFNFVFLLCLCNSALLCQKGWLVKKKIFQLIHLK